MKTRNDQRASGDEVMPTPPGARPQPGQKIRPNVAAQSDIIVPFLVTGGAAGFTEVPGGGGPVDFDPVRKGAQLVTSIYVPSGRVGFLKQIRVGPRKPAVLHDVWDAGGIVGPYTTPGPGPEELAPVSYQVNEGNGSASRDAIHSGIWWDPMGWEVYRSQNITGDFEPLCTWQWQLTLVRGTLADLRRKQNIPPFSFTDPASWYLIDNLPVPFGLPNPIDNAYPGGIPGSPIGPFFGPQRLQATPKDPLNVHVMIPEDTTLCLFTTWLQPHNFELRFTRPINTNLAQADPGLLASMPRDGAIVGPSYGSLSGYLQPGSSQAGVDNATHGWGG